MNTNREIQKTIAFLAASRPDDAARCRVAALHLRTVLLRRRWRRERNELLRAAVAAAEAGEGGR